MVSEWWLQSHQDVKTLDGAAWLKGFYGRLKEEDLHETDRDYLAELVAWHKEKENVEEPVPVLAPASMVVASNQDV